jgi:hypothetical protein
VADSRRLADAYQRLVDIARTMTIREPSGEADTVDWILAHVTLYDGLLARAARRVRVGALAVINEPTALCADAIAAMIATTGSRSELIDVVERDAARFVASVAEVPDARADLPVLVRLVNRSRQPVFSAWLPWRDLIRIRIEDQIPQHCARLADQAQLLWHRHNDIPTADLCRCGQDDLA